MGRVIAHIKKVVLIPIVLLIGIFAVIAVPHFVSAEAGSGGGGSSSGCSRFTYSTCVGAVWRYYTTSSNAVSIPAVSGPATVVRNCGSTGGYFAYVLVNKYDPNNASAVRTWKIGPVDGNAGNRSQFFGGWTHYYVASNPSDPIPSSPTARMYSWYSAKKAFDQTKSLGQNSGFTWDANSSLGWFCYKGLNFNLTPTITGSPSSAEGGGTIGLDGTVTNTGPTGTSNINWQITSFTLAGGETPPAASTNTTAPADLYNKPGNHRTTERDLTSQFNKIGANAIARQNVTLGDYEVGTRVCYVLSIKPYTQSAPSGWRHSDAFCVVVAKKPKVQVLGGDLVVGKGTTSVIAAGTTPKKVGGSTRTFGSWGEYGVLASGIITGFGSGAGYSGGSTTTGTSDVVFCAASYLTFTSAGTSTCTAATSKKGEYPLTKQLPDIAGRFVPLLDIGGNTVNVTSASSGVYGKNIRADIYPGPTITVTASQNATVGKGKSVIIVAPTATVNITANINYTVEGLGRASDIPQVVIIADKININAGVTNVDAWLIATGSVEGSVGAINTCAEITNPATQLNSTKCNQKLTVNGPVVTKHLYLYRTAGSETGTGTGNPAEVFNLRPDAYLWATNYIANAGRLQTVSTKELPPRF